MQATVSGSTSCLKSSSRPAQRVLGRDAAVRVRRRRAVDVGRERAEALLVDELRGHRHRQVRAAVEGAVEDDDAGSAGRGARDLDGVLDRLGARVTSRIFCRRRAGPELVEPPADLDVRLVDPDHEALVQVAVDLLVDRRDDGRVAVAEVLAGDAAGEVEVLAALGVPDPRAPGARDDERRRRDAARDVALARVGDAGGFALHCGLHHFRPDLLRITAAFCTARRESERENRANLEDSRGLAHSSAKRSRRRG